MDNANTITDMAKVKLKHMGPEQPNTLKNMAKSQLFTKLTIRH